jgi:hypothetical protein
MNPFNYKTEETKRPLVTWLMRIALVAGCLFTGMHNFSLYYRGLNIGISETTRKAIAVGVAFLLEAAFYFAVEGRGRVFTTDEQRKACLTGASVIFGVIVINTITDHAMNVGSVHQGDWLALWATYGAAACVVAVVGFIGYLKAYSAEAMLAAEAAKAEAARVRFATTTQQEILNDPLVIERYKEQARAWAIGITDAQIGKPQAALPPVAELEAADDHAYVNGAATRPNAPSRRV